MPIKAARGAAHSPCTDLWSATHRTAIVPNRPYQHLNPRTRRLHLGERARAGSATKKRGSECLHVHEARESRNVPSGWLRSWLASWLRQTRRTECHTALRGPKLAAEDGPTRELAPERRTNLDLSAGHVGAEGLSLPRLLHSMLVLLAERGRVRLLRPRLTLTKWISSFPSAS